MKVHIRLLIDARDHKTLWDVCSTSTLCKHTYQRQKSGGKLKIMIRVNFSLFSETRWEQNSSRAFFPDPIGSTSAGVPLDGRAGPR